MNEQEKHAASQEERKEKIRARYKVVNRSELEFIPAKQKEKLFEDAGKYMKKGYPLPTLQVVDQGALKGFVPVNRAWNGFSSADYKKASLSAYSENNNEIFV